MRTVSENYEKVNGEDRSALGIEFTLFILYLTFIFFNPQDLFPFIKPFRLPLILAAGSLVLCLTTKRVAIFSATQSKLMLVFIILTVASTFNSINFNYSLNFLEMWLKGFAFYLLVILNTDTKDRLRKFIWVLVVFMFINASFTFIAGKIGLMPPTWRMVSYFGGGGANDFALMLLAPLPFALILFDSEKEPPKKIFLVTAALSFLLCLTRTRSRMGFLGIFILIAQVLWAKRKRPGIILLVIALGLFVAMNTHSRYFQRVETIMDEEEAENIRIKLWRQASKMIEKRPWLGVGPGNYIEAKEHFDIPGNKAQVAHNSFLQVGAENGIPSVIVFVLIGLVTLRKLFKLEKKLMGKETELFAICQASRQCIIVVVTSMVFLSQQQNHFYMIIPALSVSIERMVLQESA